jgi:iron complex transport system substrate-binding protein
VANKKNIEGNMAKKLFFIFIFLIKLNYLFAHPITLNDDLNREIKINKKPKRIVSLAPSITEILFALKLNKEIVGVTNFCNYPKHAKNKEKVGGFTNPSLEKIVSLKPDLVIATYGNPLNLINKLNKLKINTFVINPKNINDVIKNIEVIGKLTGKEKCAKNLTKKLKDKMNKIIKLAKKLKKKKVFLLLWDKPLTTVGSKTYINDLVDLVGCENIAKNSKLSYPIYSLEKLIIENPDIIILIGMGENWKHKIKKIKNNHIWEKISAVKNNKIYLIDPDLVNRPGPRIVNGLEELFKIIHQKHLD